MVKYVHILQLASITDRMVRSLDYNLSDFLSEMDRSVAASRRVFAQMDAATRQLNAEQWQQIEIKVRAGWRSDGELPLL